MKKLLLLLIFFTVLALTGCLGDDEATEEPTDDLPGVPEATAIEPGPPDDPGSDGYPGPPVDGGYPAPLPPTPLSPGYPPPSPEPTMNAYPGGFAIFTRPVGLQCEDPPEPDEEAIVAELEKAGVVVQEISLVEFQVCEACGCPTSDHFRVLIDPGGMLTIERLGWFRAYQ